MSTATPDRVRTCSRNAGRGRVVAWGVLAASIALASPAAAQTGVWRQVALPGLGIFDVARGDSATVLVATTPGAFQIDGLRVRRVPIFSPTADSLAGSAILHAATGDVWLGTSNFGLFRLKPDGSVVRYTAASGIGNSSNDHILDLAETRDGAIWAATNTGGLSRFDGMSWTTLTLDQGMPSMTVSSLAVDSTDGSVWAGTLGPAAGLVHVVNGAVAAVYNVFALTPTQDVRAVTVTRAGDVWIGNAVGIARLAGGAFVEYSVGTAATAVCEGAHGELWFGTGNRGVGRWDVGATRILPSGPPSNNTRSLIVDAAGVVWVGTTGGLARFEGAQWLSYSKTDRLPISASPLAAVRDRSAAARGDSLDAQGITWFGTTTTFDSPIQSLSLSRRAGGRMLHYGTAEGLPRGPVASLAVSDSGTVWCGTASVAQGGLARVRADGSVARMFDVPSGFPSGFVLGLADAGDGAVWAATAGGAVFVDRTGYRMLRTGAGALPDAPLVGVAVDAQGRAWFASGQNPFGIDGRSPAGAVRFDPADSSYFQIGATQGLVSDDLNGVTVAPNGDVWFASDLGVGRLRNGAMLNFSVADGLPSSVVSRIAVAPDGTVWAATDEGVALFDGTLWASYNVGDGLIGSRAVDVFADSLGVIASCKVEGVSLFHPDRTPPRVEITSGPAPATGAATVQFSVRGGDLDSDPGRVRISSELEGRAPTPFAEDVDAISLNLLDGDYVFRVRGKDRALNETLAPAEWRFTVDATPPRPVVQQPAFNAIVKDTVHVIGTVADARLAGYVVELRAAGTVPWDTLFASPTPPAPGAPIYDWPSRNVNDGVWELRVGAIDSLGLIGYAQVSVIVDNFAPSASVTAPAKLDHVTGGHVFTTGGEVDLFIPPNAFAADQIVRIDPLPLAGPTMNALAAWVIRANDPTLAKPGTLTLRIPDPVAIPFGRGAQLASSPGGPGYMIAQLTGVPGDSVLVPVGGTTSADGRHITASISTLGAYAIVVNTGIDQGFVGVRDLDCQPRVFSPRGGGFDTRAAISFELGQGGTGAIKVYDRSGRLVREVAESTAFPAGSNVVYWDGTDGDGQVVPSGLYTVAARFDGKTAVRTVVVANR